MTTHIQLNTLRVYGFHGVMPQEQKVGAWYEIDIDMEVEVKPEAYANDDLSGTISYADVLEDVKKEFAQRSQLLEHLAYRIATRILKAYKLCNSLKVSVKKVAPPLCCNIDSAAVVLSMDRSDVE